MNNGDLVLPKKILEMLEPVTTAMLARDYILTTAQDNMVAIITGADIARITSNGSTYANSLYLPALVPTTLFVDVAEIKNVQGLVNDFFFTDAKELAELIKLVPVEIWNLYFSLDSSTTAKTAANLTVSATVAPTKLPLTYDAVKDQVIDEIDHNGSATTLSVKSNLRNKGYHAIQKEVSDFMKQVAKQEDLDFNASAPQSDGTTYLVYSKK